MSDNTLPDNTTATPVDGSTSVPVGKNNATISDVVYGDKFSGDKVGGDKIVGEVIVTGYVAGDVIVHIPEKLDIPPPPTPRRSPNVPLLLGRDESLTIYTQALDKEGIAVISGMAGIGKTSLAASLARRCAKPAHIFWHQFHEADNVDALIWDLAGFLAFHGQDTLWNLIQTATISHGRPPPTNVQFDYLIQHLQGQPYLLCLDDFHHVMDDPSLGLMVERLLPILHQGQLKLILTSRELPDFVLRSSHTGLAGLSPEAVKHFLAINDIQLDTKESTQLQSYTGGNPQLLTLAADLLQGNYDLPTLLQKLVQAADIEDFLMEEIEDSLSRRERAVMGAIALLQGYPGSREAIEAILDGQNVRRTLRDLSNRFLLTVTKSDDGDLYGQHAIVQDYFYDALSRRQKPQMHHLAAEYYRDEASDMFLAARHFLAANDQPEAAEILIAHAYALLNRGLARPLNQLLGRFMPESLDAYTLIALMTTTGQVKAFLGENKQAQEKFETAFAKLAEMPTTPETDELVAKACLGLGELLEFQQPAIGLQWVMKGLARESLTSKGRAALNILAGTLHMHLGNYETAQNEIHAGLANLSSLPNQERCQALLTLSGVHFYLGTREEGMKVANEALAISRSLGDPFQEAAILNNIGLFQHTSGEWKTAINSFQEAFKIAQALGSTRDLVEFQSNLGAALINTGDFTAAEQNLIQALHSGTKLGEELILCIINTRLAELEIKQEKWEEAANYLDKAEKLAAVTKTENQLPAIYSFKVEISLGKGNCLLASKYAQLALRSAQHLNDPFETGIALRMIGLVEAACGDVNLAVDYFKQSIEQLKNLDALERARSQLELISLQSKSPNLTKEERDMADALKAVFTSLGAQKELRNLEKLELMT